ncbi:MAG: FkbM family methyltransferase [Candidatus Acidiferrales bacterium]
MGKTSRRNLDIRTALSNRGVLARAALLIKLLRIGVTPSSSLLRTRIGGGLVVAGYNRDGYGGRGLYLYGESIEPELLVLGRFLQPGFVFVDVGANVGVYTTKAAGCVGENGLVLAIEPFIETAFRLSCNVRANHLRNVRIRPFCLGAHTCHERLYLRDNKPNSFSMAKSSGTDSISVLSVSLDDLAYWEKLERMDYLKIDAEGAEQDILSGGARAIGKFRPIVQVETDTADCNPPPGYRRFAANRSANSVFIPRENVAAVQIAIDIGWDEK